VIGLIMNSNSETTSFHTQEKCCKQQPSFVLSWSEKPFGSGIHIIIT